MTEHPTQDGADHAAVLWTGGKDSCLALYEARLRGYQVERLVTFVPSQGQFRAHPLEVMELQAQALALPHHTVEIREPYKAAYQEAIATLRERWATGTLVTGDMAEVDGHPNWIAECCAGSETSILTPLWGGDRMALLNRFISCGFKAVFSCVRTAWLAPEWVGRSLDGEATADLSVLAGDNGLDICGEQGEYHTLVLNGPLFEKRIRLDACSTVVDGDLAYLHVGKASLETPQHGTHRKDRKPSAPGDGGADQPALPGLGQGPPSIHRNRQRRAGWI
jgi:diphthine-ammonia ligase